MVRGGPQLEKGPGGAGLPGEPSVTLQPLPGSGRGPRLPCSGPAGVREAPELGGEEGAQDGGMNGCPGEEGGSAGEERDGEGALPTQTAQRASAPCLIHKNFHLPLERSEPGQRKAVRSAK